MPASFRVPNSPHHARATARPNQGMPPLVVRGLLNVTTLLMAMTAVAWAGDLHDGASPTVWALRNAHLIIAPGREIAHGTLVMRHGAIAAVGEHVAIPPEARMLDMHGRTVHAGFIDPYVTTSRLEGRKTSKRGPFVDNDDDDAPASAGGDGESEKPARFTPGVASSANTHVFADYRVADHLQPKKDALNDLREQGFVLVQAVLDRGIFRGQAAIYQLGEGPVASQIVNDASASVLTFELGSGGDKAYPGSMMGNVALMRQTFAEARWYQQSLEASRRHYAGNLRPTLETSLQALTRPLEASQPMLCEAESLLEVLRLHKVLDEAQVRQRAVVLSGEEWRQLAWLSPLANKAAWVLPVDFPTPPPARSSGEWAEVALQTLRAWRYAPSNPRLLHQAGLNFSLTTHRLPKVSEFGSHVHEAIEAGLPASTALAALTTLPARQLGLADRYGTLEVGKSASLVVRQGKLFDPKSKVCEVWIEGNRQILGDGEEPEPKAPAKDKTRSAKQDGEASKESVKGTPAKSAPPGNPPAFASVPLAPAVVLVRNATLWTQGPQGVLPHGDLLVRGGKIAVLGQHLTAPPGATVIEAQGMHVTPGIIDAHSHTAVDGAVNEMLAPVTAQVRIKDVINPFDLNIYRELAGGVTTANVLHGSGNAIGGQVVTCKWRWGSDGDHLLLEGAPEGIKFALGENPRHANGNVPEASLRYPKTRMGVAELIRERFAAARTYRTQQKAFAAGRRPIAPRPDLQLEALLEILDGKRMIHCHSYRQDEILALLRIAAAEGFNVQTFQHVLEGYKIAQEIARSGAMASTFSDWWAYKMEVMDAIPYNGALLHEKGVVTSFNSDSDEQARRLNTEAAKAVRYGNLSDSESLAFVTSNPARQLGISHRVGSLEVGKDADFVLWNDHPLKQKALAMQTWIEGRRYFDRSHDLELRRQFAQERSELLKLARQAAKTSKEEKK